MSESMGDIKEKLENSNLSQVSIYSIDRDLEVGDIVYGYLTSPFKAKRGTIIPRYPFKVIGKSFSTIYLLGQKSIGGSTFDDIFDSHLDWYYVHFLRDGKDQRFDSVRIPSVNDLQLVDFKNLDVRDTNSFWTVSRDQHISESAWAVRNGQMTQFVHNFKTALIPFAEIPYPNPNSERGKAIQKELIHREKRKLYRSTLEVGPCGKGDKACYLCDCGYGCMTGADEDDFDLADMDLLISRLDNPRSVNAPDIEKEKAHVIKVLKEMYGYEYKEKE